MRLVLAPDSFKESLTAQQAAQAMSAGVRAVLPDADLVLIPMADGGEGTVQSLVDATSGHIVTRQVRGPLGRQVEARFGMLGDGHTAIIEMAEASGLQLVPVAERNPLVTTTYGTGELIRAALEEGARSIILGIGGSATVDGGAGMAQALGYRLTDASGAELAPGGAALADLAHIDASGADPRLRALTILIASDVTNPLTGPEGSAAVFGPQKGATPEMVSQLDAALAHFARVVRTDLGREVDQATGAGAAGGLGAGLLAFTESEMRSGFDIVAEYAHLAEACQGADFVLTGEGSIDRQTLRGKTPLGVAQVAKHVAPDTTVIALAGRIGPGAEELYTLGIDAIFSIVPGATTLSDALSNGAENITRTTENVMRFLLRVSA
ncbi:MAG: glycerate kinase [Microbacteriaceae bacterium]|jgi:glycerate kinase|nr:glycerate kinase [Microbacteriaceae bacterium]MCI1206741.1 glycerate kinase [Microbacteriaceae bacterium]